MSEYMERDAQRHIKEMDERPEEEELDGDFYTDEEMEEYREQMRRLKQPKKVDWLEIWRDKFIRKTENLAL